MSLSSLFKQKKYWVVGLILISLAAPASVYAADTSILHISVPDGSVEFGQRFTIDINVNPDRELVGLQTNLNFNPNVIKIEGVLEGDLLNQDGVDTFFSPGQIDNTKGIVKGMFGAILNPGKTVSSQGTFATLTCTALNTEGNSSFSLSNVIVGCLDGQSLPVSVISNSVHVTSGTGSGKSTDSSSETNTVSNESSGGGGGVVNNTQFTTISSSANRDGILWEEVTANSVDIKAQLEIPVGTTVLNANGYPPSSLTITTIEDSTDPPDNYSIIGNIYDFSPAGVTFEPSANLTLRYEEGTLPESVDESNLLLATLNTESGEWEFLPSQIDTENNWLRTSISHFSQYAILAGTRPASFVCNDLTLTPRSPHENEEVTATIILQNNGDLEGTIEVDCLVNNVIVSRQDIILGGGNKTAVSFSFKTGSKGLYTLQIGSSSTQFTVISEEPNTGKISGLEQGTDITNGPDQSTDDIVQETVKPAMTFKAITNIATNIEEQISRVKSIQRDNIVEFTITVGSGGIFVVTMLLLIIIRRGRR